MMNYPLTDWEEKFKLYLAKRESDDGSHDLGHFQRVWGLCSELASESEDQLVLLAASYFHDLINYPKNDPRRSLSSRHSAERASAILREMNFPEDKINDVSHCIEAHSYSAGIEPLTDEAKILQDADRMESLGAIGLARTFYVAGRMGSKLFNSEDPFAKQRQLDDKSFAIDHFETKLLKLPSTMKTKRGKAEALKRAKVLSNFLETLKGELS